MKILKKMNMKKKIINKGVEQIIINIIIKDLFFVINFNIKYELYLLYVNRIKTKSNQIKSDFLFIKGCLVGQMGYEPYRYFQNRWSEVRTPGPSPFDIMGPEFAFGLFLTKVTDKTLGLGPQVSESNHYDLEELQPVCKNLVVVI